MSKIALFIFAMLILCIGFAVAKDQLDYSRIHLVDVVKVYSTNNYFFRTNIPIDNDAFGYDMLVSSFKQRAADEGITLPNNFYMIDISLMNDFDENQIEKGFWSDIQNVNLGEYIFWPMGLAGLYDARSYQEPERSQMANSTVWEFDHLPDRAQQLMMMMHTPGPIDPATGQPRPKVIFAHCQAGCDRTGQMIISYRLATTKKSDFTPNTLQEYFELNVNECGRPPNDWSVKATEWFCLYMGFNFGVNMGDCLHIADCQRFGKCTWPPV